jgi:hypothetical protein
MDRTPWRRENPCPYRESNSSLAGRSKVTVWNESPRFLYRYVMTTTALPVHQNVHCSQHIALASYDEGVSKSFRTKSIKKYTFIIINTRWEATQSVMAAKLTRLTHQIAIQLLLAAETYTIFSFRSRWPVRKLLDTPSHTDWSTIASVQTFVTQCIRHITILTQSQFTRVR